MEEILCIQDLEVAFTQYESRSTKKIELPVISRLNVRVCEELQLLAAVARGKACWHMRYSVYYRKTRLSAGIFSFKGSH